MKHNPIHTAFSHLLLSGTFVHEASFQEIQQLYGVDSKPQLVMVISIDRYPDLIGGKEMSWKKEVGQTLVSSVYEAISCPFVWAWIAEGVLALLVELPQEYCGRNMLDKQTFAIGKRIQEAAASQEISVSIGIGTCYERPEMLHCSFKEAKQSMVDRFFEGNQLIFQYKSRNRNEKPIGDPHSDQERMELLARVRIGDEEGVADFLRILMDKKARTYRFNVDLFKSELIDLIMQMSRLVLESGANAVTILSDNTYLIQELYHTVRYEKFVQKVCDYGRKLTEQISRTHTLGASLVIKKAVCYMKGNLSRRISLEEVASYCCLSKYHFSHLFKRDVGISFVDFLNKIRIEKALQYLETTDLAVQQIAHLVGFEESSYFTRTFRKYMQHSPTAYRTARLCKYDAIPTN